MSENTLGQIAFDAYGDNREWKDWRGMPMPAWTAVSPEIQVAWEVAAQAVGDRARKDIEMKIGTRADSPFTKWCEQPIAKQWREALDYRELNEVAFSQLYAVSFAHGTDGHNAKIIIAKLSTMLDSITRQLEHKEDVKS